VTVAKGKLLRHLRQVHNIAQPRTKEQYECECKAKFDSLAARRTHRISCRTFKAANANAAAKHEEEQAAAETIETFGHFWKGECSAFTHSRANLPNFVQTLLARLASVNTRG
jgi:hypothetical protein